MRCRHAFKKGTNVYKISPYVIKTNVTGILLIVAAQKAAGKLSVSCQHFPFHPFLQTKVLILGEEIIIIVFHYRKKKW